MNDICIFEPGRSIPECHPNAVCRSRKHTFGSHSICGLSLLGSRTSCSAIAIAREAGPNPMQMRSCISSPGTFLNLEVEDSSKVLSHLTEYPTWLVAVTFPLRLNPAR